MEHDLTLRNGARMELHGEHHIAGALIGRQLIASDNDIATESQLANFEHELMRRNWNHVNIYNLAAAAAGHKRSGLCVLMLHNFRRATIKFT